MTKTFTPILILKWKRSSHLHLHVDSHLYINHDPYIPQGKSFMMQSVEETVLLLMQPLTIHLFPNSRKLAAAKYTHHGPKQNTKNGEERRERDRRETQEQKRERERERERALERSSALRTFRSEPGGGDEYSALAEWRVIYPETAYSVPQGLWERHCHGWNGDAELSW
jgi:hypothetical protein